MKLHLGWMSGGFEALEEFFDTPTASGHALQVPAGTYRIEVQGGGGGRASTGGEDKIPAGAFSAEFTFGSTTDLTIFVGSSGDNGTSGAGGGWSGVRVGSTDLIIAGGVGGEGYQGGGGNDGDDGADGGNTDSYDGESSGSDFSGGINGGGSSGEEFNHGTPFPDQTTIPGGGGGGGRWGGTAGTGTTAHFSELENLGFAGNGGDGDDYTDPSAVNVSGVASVGAEGWVRITRIG